MKKLDAIMRRSRIFFIVGGILILLVTAWLFMLQRSIAGEANQTRSTLRLINTVTALVRDKGDLAAFDWDGLNAELRNSIDAELPRELAGSDPAEFRRLANVHAAAYNQLFYDRLHSTLDLSSLTVILSALVLIGFLLILQLVLRRMNHFRIKVDEHLQAIGDLIHFKPAKPFSPDVWPEDHALSEASHTIMDEMSFTRRLIELGAREIHLDQLMKQLLEIVQGNIPCDRISLAFIDSFDNVVAEDFAARYERTHFQIGYQEKLETSTLAELSKSKRPRVLNDLEAYVDGHPGSEISKALLLEGLKSSITMPLVSNDRCVAFLFINSRRKDVYLPEHVERALQLVHAIRNTLLHLYTLQQVLAETSQAFVTLMERKDNETSLHIRRMSYYSYYIAKVLAQKPASAQRLGPRQLREILWFAPLHDIGKVGIPDRILLKEGPLDGEERKYMENHVYFGAQVMKSISRALNAILGESPFESAVEIIEGHHEKWNGAGYPTGASGESIPLVARIVSIGDVLDALTSRRPYKEAWAWDRAVTWIRERAGVEFDPDVVDAFVEALPLIQSVYERYKEV